MAAGMLADRSSAFASAGFNEAAAEWPRELRRWQEPGS